MKNPELDSILRSARLPDIAQESLEMFPRRIVARLGRKDPPSPAPRSLLPRLAWVLGLAACVILAFAMSHWRGRMGTGATPPSDTLASAKFIREMMATFPNRVRAVVKEGGSLNLVLSDSEDVPESPPLYVRICDDGHCASLVTFSGQEIQVDGQKITVLADARGGIILTGSQFVWSSSGRTDAGSQLKIEAKNLGALAM